MSVPRRLSALVAGAALAAVVAIAPPTPAAMPAAGSTVSTSLTSVASAAPKLTIRRATAGPIVTGTRVTFTGTAPKSRKGQRVQLQRRVGRTGDWVLAATVKVARSGQLTATGVSTGVGTNTWRFVLRAAKKTLSSATTRHPVYGWFFLSDQDSVDSDGMNRGSVVMGGRTYSKSVYGDGSTATDYADYNLSYRCLRLEAWIGIGDDSETGTTADFYVTIDGARSGVGSKGLGSASRIVVDTATRLRIRIEADPTNGAGPSGTWAFGNARALCSGRP